MAAKVNNIPLWSAVSANDYDLCAKLSEGEEGKRRLREEAAFMTDDSPLHEAVKCVADREAILELFIKQGFDVNFPTPKYGYSPLYKAVMAGKVKYVRMLIDSGAKVDLPTDAGATPLHEACSSRLPEMMPRPTPEALQALSHEIITLLLERGADIHKLDKMGHSAGHYAATAPGVETIMFVAAKGARFDLLSEDGETPLHYLANRFYFHVSGVENLSEVKASTDVVKELIARGSGINAQTKKTGDTALHLAVRQGNPSIVKVLVAQKAKVDIKNNEGKTALDLAREKDLKRSKDNTKENVKVLEAAMNGRCTVS